MKLITDAFQETQQVIEEGADGKKHVYLCGKYMQPDVVNGNGRVYPSAILDPVVAKFITEKIGESGAMGELNHPQSAQVNPDRVSHLIKELKKEDGAWVGRAKLLHTPCGNIARELAMEGVRLGMSSRAVGSLKARADGVQEVQKDLKLSTIDIVSTPSGPDCFVRGILEGVEFWFDEEKGVVAQTFAEQARETLRAATVREVEEHKLALFEHYLGVVARARATEKI